MNINFDHEFSIIDELVYETNVTVMTDFILRYDLFEETPYNIALAYKKEHRGSTLLLSSLLPLIKECLKLINDIIEQ